MQLINKVGLSMIAALWSSAGFLWALAPNCLRKAKLGGRFQRRLRVPVARVAGVIVRTLSILFTIYVSLQPTLL